MKLLGIVSEYNPFHKGHKFHIEAAKEKTACDGVVSVMSGNFVQRGEGALFDKLSRAEAATKNGVDLIFELSPYFSLSSAERFALSGVKLLSSIPEVKFLAFGAENTDVELFNRAADILINEPFEYKKALKDALKDGISFASAREKAFLALGEDELIPLVQKPNNILGVEYIKAIKRLNADLVPVPIKREGSSHDSLENTTMPSASFLRKAYFDKEVDLFKSGVPESVISEKYFDNEEFEKAILSKIILTDKEELKKYDGISEGLENRIKDLSKKANSFEELLEMVKSKRFAYSRIKRSLVLFGLGIEKSEALPGYLKVLSFNENGQKILNKIKKTSMLPVLKNMTALKKLKDENLIKMWEKEAEIDRVYELYLKKGVL